MVLVRLLVPVSLFSAPVSLEAPAAGFSGGGGGSGPDRPVRLSGPGRSGTFDEPLPEDVPTGVLGGARPRQRILGVWVEYHDGCTVQTREGWTEYRFYADWRDMLILAYLAGAAVTAIVMAASNLRFARRLRRRRGGAGDGGALWRSAGISGRGWRPPACADWCSRQFT